ncbi:MAG: hypothetical protein SGJ24_14405 [Chloroflexota bacterium]|nr:hypothetical protein [Chloroflexota bacterium]
MPFGQFTPLLAHGALGAFDELLLIGVVVAFIVIMGISYMRSRSLEPTDAADLEAPFDPSREFDQTVPVEDRDSSDRYKLD